MKLAYLLVFVGCFAVNVFAQDNSTIPSTSIPRSEKNTPNTSNNAPQYSISKPFNPQRFKTAKKFDPISMDKPMQMQSQVSDLNPGLQYEKKLNKSISGESSVNAIGANTYFGVITTKSEFINIKYRDFSMVDGDLIQVFVDNLIIERNVELREHYKEITVRLVEGKNTISFLALNEGASSPNTAQFQILDTSGAILYDNQWGLLTGFNASIDIVKLK